MTDLPAIISPIQDDMQKVDEVIRQRLTSNVVLINQLGEYIVKSGGKRLRPAVVLLAARATGYKGEHHSLLAAIIELIHTATLLHDDVVDGSDLRRGQETANALWGNEASVLTGDFLYSRAFQMMVELESITVMKGLADATNTIAEGEVLQLMNINDPEVDEKRYMEVIWRKTAVLFQAGTELGAHISLCSPEEQTALSHYGLHLGTAFQLIDDALDYQADTKSLGKNLGDDLAEGKPTLPLIHVMNKGNPEQIKIVKEAIQTGNLEHMPAVMEAIESTGAIAYTSARATDEAKMAIDALAQIPESPYKTSLIQLAEFAVLRNF